MTSLTDKPAVGGGVVARRGLAFQDLVLAKRILEFVEARRMTAITGGATPQSPTFGVEGKVGDDGPDWDIVEIGALATILEEVKSGALEADEREILWRRVRLTLSTLPSELPPNGMVLRLTVNKATPISRSWRDLRSNAYTASATWTAAGDGRRRPVRSGADLVSEAITALTTPDSLDGTPPVAEETARRLLASFELVEFDRDELEQLIATSLARLSAGLPVQEMQNELRGAIATRAENLDSSYRRFLADDLLLELSVLERFASVDPESARIWRELETRSAERLCTPVDLPSSGLRYVDWRRLHHEAAAALATEQRTVILGRGGLGKSVMLATWAQERLEEGAMTMLLAGVDLAPVDVRQLSDALRLGAFLTELKGDRLVIAVDALENCGDEDRMRELIACLPEYGATAVATCRASRWLAARASHETLPGWCVVALTEWPEELVRKEVNASARPEIGAELVQLLRTPLLLDLFLRTFGNEKSVPAGVQTRHAVLSAYWSRRILPADDPRSAERVALLDNVASEAANGLRRYSHTGRACEDLVSEGLFSLVMGRLHFRHALLRDFALAQWALMGDDHDQVADRVARIKSRLVRFGGLRALTEAILISPDVHAAHQPRDLLRAIAGVGLLDDEAVALGELDDPAFLDFASLVEAVPAEDRSLFATHLVRAARLSSNAVWLSPLSGLPAQGTWAEATTWVDSGLVIEIAKLIIPDRTVGAVKPLTRPSFLAAHCLREWTRATKFDIAFAQEQSSFIVPLLRTVPRTLPSTETLAWLLLRGTMTGWACYWTLSELSVLAGRARNEGVTLDGDLLVSVYTRAAGLRRDSHNRLEETLPEPVPNGDYQRINVALIGSGVNRDAGLLATHPELFTEVAVAMIAGHEHARERKHREEMAHPFERSVDTDFEFERSADVQALERAAREAIAAEPNLGAATAEDVLVEGSLCRPYWDLHDHSLKELLSHLSDRAAQSLHGDATFFDRFFAPAVLAGASLVCKLLVLDLLTREGAPPDTEWLTPLVADERMYRRDDAHVYLQRAIRLHWSQWRSDVRSTVVTNIRRSAVGERGSIYNPGPLLAAIPEPDRPANLAPLLELFTGQRMRLDLEEREAPYAYNDFASEPPAAPPIEELSEAGDRAWRELEQLDGAKCASAQGDDWTRYTLAVRRVAVELPPPMSLVGRSSGVELISKFLRRCARNPDEPGLPGTDVETLLSWGLKALAEFGPSEVNSGCRPLGSSDVGLPDHSMLWVRFVGMCDATLWIADLRARRPLHDEFIIRLDDVLRVPEDRVAYWVLSEMTGWFRCEGAGKPLLWALLVERVRNAVALVHGLTFLERFDKGEQVTLLRHWLTESLSPPINAERTLVRTVGEHVGCAALSRYVDGGTTGSHDVIDELMRAPSSAGPLADPGLHAQFVSKVVFGLKTAVAIGRVPVERSAEYASFLAGAWKALNSSISAMKPGDRPAFALWAFHVVLDDPFDPGERAEGRIQPADVPRWWGSLRSVARMIAGDGPSWEVEAPRSQGSCRLRPTG